MNLFLLLYLMGITTCFMLALFTTLKIDEVDVNLNVLLICLLFSLSSWIGVVFFLDYCGIYKIKEFGKTIKSIFNYPLIRARK